MKFHIWRTRHTVFTQMNCQHSFVSYFSLYDILLSPPGWWSIFTSVSGDVHRQKVMRKKFNISVWAVNWNDLWKFCYFAQCCPSFVSLFSSRIGFSSRFLFRVYFSSFPVLENIKCCSKCRYCNATDHRRRPKFAPRLEIHRNLLWIRRYS